MTIKTEQRGHLYLIGIDRPAKRNAFNIEMWEGLALAYGELDRNPDLWCGLVYAEGEHFTAGLELDKWAPIMAVHDEFPLPEGGIDPFALSGKRVSKPLVIAVQGICFTVGLELMLATDIRIAAKGTRFGQIEVKRGIYPVGGATLRMHTQLGWGNAMRYLLTGDEFSAEEAYRIGLVQEVVEHGQQFEKALEIAERVAAQAPLGVQATLTSARLTLAEGEAVAARRLLPDLRPILQSEDAQEGVMSFLERRQANFKGK